jgi:flagellar protein FlaJ
MSDRMSPRIATGLLAAEPRASDAGDASGAEVASRAARRRRVTIAVLALTAIGMLLLTAATVWRLAAGGDAFVDWAAVLALGLAISVGWGLDHIPGARSHDASAEIRRWQVLKVLAILLNALVLLAILVLAGSLIAKAGFGAGQDAMHGIATMLAWALGAITVATFIQALRNDLELDRSMAVALAHVVTILLAFGAATFAVISGGEDAPLILLVAWSLVALDLFLTRGVPNIYTLLSDPRAGYKGRAYLGRSKSVFLPIAVAFALLLTVFLVVLAVGQGAEDAAGAIQASPLTAVIAVTVTAAAIATVVIARRLAREEDKPELYHRAARQEEMRGRLLLWVSLTLGTLGALLAGIVLSGRGGVISTTWWVDILAAAVLLTVGPYGFYAAYEDRRVRALEERLPDFLRDIAASHNGGLTLMASVRVAARGDYGALSPYVQRMADQMTWNVSFEQSLQWLAEQMRTPLVARTVHLILEADRSGGGTADVLLAAARDARELKKMETDRRISLGLYTLVIHITFGVFLLVAAVLYHQFIPAIAAAGDAATPTTDALTNVPSVLQPGHTDLAEYRAFYYVAALVQAVGGGLVAGLMTTGRAKLGLQHAFIMTALAFIVFTFLLV